jgi:PhnB protein
MSERPVLTIRITCAGAARAIAFYKKAFGAVEGLRLDMPDGRVGHAELRIGNAVLEVNDEFPEMSIRSPQAVGGTPATLCLDVGDTDRAVAKAVEAGAKIVKAPADEFYGYRAARISDPFGHVWAIMTNTEKLSDAEIRRRFDDMMKQPAKTPA